MVPKQYNLLNCGLKAAPLLSEALEGVVVVDGEQFLSVVKTFHVPRSVPRAAVDVLEHVEVLGHVTSLHITILG